MTMFGTIPTLNTLPSVNTVQPLSRIEPLYRLPQIKQIPTLNGRQFYKSYNPNTKEVYRSPFAIDSLSDVLLNKEGKRRLAAKYGVDTDNLLGGISGTLIAGVHYIKDSYLTPIVQGEPTTFLFNAYSSLMEDVDVFANITKGAIIEADSEIPSLVVGGIAAIAAGVAVVASGGTALGAIGAGFVASGVAATATAFQHDYDAAARGVMRGIGLGDEGKYYYEFDTNNVFLNILGEVAVDPLNWLSFSQKLVIGAAKRTGYNLAKTHLKTLVRLGELDDVFTKGMFYANPIGGMFKATTIGFKWGRSTAYKAFSSIMDDYKGNMLNYDFMAINDVVNTGFKKLKEFASDVRKRSMYLDYIKGNDQEIAVSSRQLMALLHKKGMSSTEAMETVRQFLELNLQGDFWAARKLLPGNTGDQAVLASIVENVLGVKYADALKIYRSNSDVVPREVSEYILGIMDMAVKFDEVYTTVRADLSGAIHKFNNSKKTKRALLEQIDEMYRGIVDRFPSFADDPDLINNAPYIKHVLSGIFEDSTSGINLDQFMAYARAVRDNGGKVLNDFPETLGEALTNIPRGTSSDLKGALSELAEMAKISVGTDIGTENFYLFTQRVKKSGPQHALKDSLPSNVKLVPRIYEMANPVHVHATLQESVAIKWLSNYESMRSINNTLDYLRNNDGDPKALQDYLGAKLSADDAADLTVFIKAYEDLRIVSQELKSMEPKGPGYSSALKRYAELHQKIMVYADSKLPELLADTSQPRVFTELLMELLVNRPEWGLFSRATLELSQKKNVYLLTMNKVRQTHFIMESVLNSDLMKLMDEISDPNSPIAMLMYRLSDANFAGLGALAKTQEDVAYVYHVVQSFRNYLNLYTEMQNLHNVKLYYSPNGELVRNMTSPYSYIIKDGRIILEPISDVSNVLGKESETIVTDIASLLLVEEATYGPELALARKLFNDEEISLDFIKQQENAMFTYQKLYNETAKELYNVEQQLDALVGDKRITEALGETRETRIERLGSQIEEYNRQIKEYNEEIKALKSDLETIKKIVESEIEVETHKIQARRSRLVSAYVRKMFEGDASINWDQQRIMRSNLETIRASSFTDGLNNEIVDAAREFKHTIGARLNLYANSPSEKSLRLADFANKPENLKLKIKRDIMGTLPDGSVASNGVYGKGTVVTKVDDVLMPSVSTHVDLALIQNHLELNYGASAKLTRDELQQVVKLVNDGQDVKSAVRQVLDGKPKYTQANNVMSSQSVRGRYFSVNTPKDPSSPAKRPNSPFAKNFDTPESYMGRMFFASDEEYLKALGASDEQIKWVSENKGEMMPKHLRYAALTNSKGKQRLVPIFDAYGNISPQPEYLVEVIERKTKISNTGSFRKAEKYNQDITRLKTKLSKTTDAAEKVQLEKTIKAITEEYNAYSAEQQKVIKDKAELMWSFFSKAFYDKVKDKRRGKFMRDMFFDHEGIEASAWVEYNLSNTLRKFYRLVSPDGDVEFNKAMNDVRRRLGLVSDSTAYEASRSVKPISEKAIKAEATSVYTEYVSRNPKIRDLLLYGDADLVAETLGTSEEITEVAKRLKILFPERRIKLQGYNVINAPMDKIVWDARDITTYMASTGAESDSFYRMFKDLLVHNKDIVEVELRFDGRPYQDSKRVLEQVRAIQAQRHSSKSSPDAIKNSRPLKVTIIGPDGKVFVDTSDNTATSSFYFHSKEMQTRFRAKQDAKYPDALLDERYIRPDFKPRDAKLESRLSDPKQKLRSGNSRLDALFDGVLDPTDDSIRQGMLSLYENDMQKFHALQDKMQLEAPGYERKDYGAFLGFINRKDKISEIEGYPRQTNIVYRDIEVPQDLDLPEGLSVYEVEQRVAEYNAKTGRKAKVKEYRGYIDTEPAKLESREPQDIHKIYKNETRVIHTEYGHGTVVDRLPDGRLAKDVDPTSVAVRFDAVRFEQYTRPELAKRTTLVHENDTILKVYQQARKTMKTVDGVTMEASHKRLVNRFLSGGVWDASFQKMHKIFQEETGSNMSYEEFLPKFRQTVGIYLTGEYKAGNITQEQYVRKMRKTFGKDIIKDYDLDNIAKVIATDDGERTLLKLILERTELAKEDPFKLPEGAKLIEEVGKGNKKKVVYEIKNHVMLVRPERTVHRANGVNVNEPQLFTPKAFSSRQKLLTQMGQDSGAIPSAPLDSVVESEFVPKAFNTKKYTTAKVRGPISTFVRDLNEGDSVAVIGSRRITPEGMDRMHHVVTLLNEYNAIMRSGGAPGADSAVDLWSVNPRIYVPEPNFGQKTSKGRVDASKLNNWSEAQTIAKENHPAWDSMNDYAKGLQSRNSYQVLGDDLNDPAKLVIAWTPDGVILNPTKHTGGTGQAIRLANKNGVPVVNLQNDDDYYGLVRELRERIAKSKGTVASSELYTVTPPKSTPIFQGMSRITSKEDFFKPDTVKEFRGEFSFLSNFYKGEPIVINGKSYKTVEHYFQASKALHLDDHEAIRNAATASEAKTLGRHVIIDKKLWEETKYDHMANALYAKFSQDPVLKQKLKDTAGRALFEGNSRGKGTDKLWGVDLATGEGENALGELLMIIRDRIIKDDNLSVKSEPDYVSPSKAVTKPKSKMYAASYSELETASKYYDRVNSELNVKYFNEADIAYSGKGVMRDGVNIPLRDLNADIERIANQFPELRPYLEAMTYEEKIRFIARPHYPDGLSKISPEKAGHMMYDATVAKESRLKRVTGSHENLINSRKSLYNRRNQIRRTVPRDLRHKPMDDSDFHNLIGKRKELTARLEELKTNFEKSKSYGTQELNQDIIDVVKATYGDKVQVSNIHLRSLREGKLSPEEFVTKINQSDGLKAMDGSVFGLTYQARQSLNLVDSKLHSDPIAPKEHIQALLNIGYDALEKIRQTHPLDAIEKLTREDLIQMFLKIKIARDYPELAEYVADLIMTYLKKQGELGRFGIKTIHMPDDAFAKKLTDLMQGGKFMDMVNGITEVKTQQDFMRARLEAFKDKFFRGKYVDGELVKGSTMDYLARIYETVDVTQALFKTFYVDMSDVASSATSFNTYHSFIGLMKFSTDPASARVISRFQQTETHVMNRFERLNDSFVRRQQQLVELGTYEDIQKQIQLDLAVMGGDNTVAIDKLTNWTIARTEVSLNDASNMNPSFADSLYNAQKHDLEFLDIARRTASMVQVYSRQAPVLTTRAGHAELARNQVGQFRNLLATEEGVDVFASMMKHNSLGGHIFISKSVLDDGFSPEGLRILREKYGIEFIEGLHDVNYFKVVNPSAGYEGLKPLGEQLTRMTPEYHPEIEKAMSELMDRLNRAVDLPHPTHWSEGSFMRWNDVSLIEYLIRQEVITEDMAGVIAEQLQRSSIMRYSMITDYEGMAEILGEYAPGSPISGIINSSISLAQHSTSKMRFADLFIREDYRVDRILGTTDAKEAYAKFRAIPGLKAVMLTNEGYVVDFAIDIKDAKIGVRQMQDAINSKAILTTYSGFTELYRKLDSFEAPKVLDWVDRNVTSAFKAGYMTSVGLPIRNLLDNNIRLLMLAEGDFRALGYIPKAHRYIDRFTEMALEMGNLKNYEEALEYLKTRSAEDLEIYRMMMVAVEAKVSGAPLKEVVDIANATRGGADFIVENVVQGTWTQRIAWGNPLTKAALEMQGWGEERYRLASFLFMLEKGSGSMEAVERIAEFFIDYSHKGHGMKTLQTLVPFGLFAVKNLQMWADHALDSPDLFRMMLDVFNTQAADSEYASKKAPSEYQMSQRLAGNKTVGGTLYKLNPSLYDAMNIIPGIFGDPLQRTTPVIKNIAALLSGDPDSIELPFETPIKRVGDILTKTLPDVMKGNTKQIPNLMPSLMSYREPFGTTTRGQYSPGVRSYNRVTGYSTDKMSARYGGRIPRSSFYVRKSYLDRGFYSKLYTASGESRIKIRQSKPTYRNLAARIRDQNYKFK